MYSTFKCQTLPPCPLIEYVLFTTSFCFLTMKDCLDSFCLSTTDLPLGSNTYLRPRTIISITSSCRTSETLLVSTSQTPLQVFPQGEEDEEFHTLFVAIFLRHPVSDENHDLIWVSLRTRHVEKSVYWSLSVNLSNILLWESLSKFWVTVTLCVSLSISVCKTLCPSLHTCVCVETHMRTCG